MTKVPEFANDRNQHLSDWLKKAKEAGATIEYTRTGARVKGKYGSAQFKDRGTLRIDDKRGIWKALVIIGAFVAFFVCVGGTLFRHT